MDNRKVIPFYMAYPTPMFYDNKDKWIDELEYFQHSYPLEVKKYQVKIKSVLQKVDYPGSFIYDEYPDRWTIQRIAKDILAMIRKEEEDFSQELIPEEKWTWTGYLVEVLLYNEIFKRRQTKKSTYYPFTNL